MLVLRLQSRPRLPHPMSVLQLYLSGEAGPLVSNFASPQTLDVPETNMMELEGQINAALAALTLPGEKLSLENGQHLFQQVRLLERMLAQYVGQVRCPAGLTHHVVSTGASRTAATAGARADHTSSKLAVTH